MDEQIDIDDLDAVHVGIVEYAKETPSEELIMEDRVLEISLAFLNTGDHAVYVHRMRTETDCDPLSYGMAMNIRDADYGNTPTRLANHWKLQRLIDVTFPNKASYVLK